MTRIAAVAVVDLDGTREYAFGPSVMEHRTADVPFQQLGTYFMTFTEEGFSEDWTLRYEETLYVIGGEITIEVLDGDSVTEVRASTGQLIALQKDATVRYGGTPGTRALLSIAPVTWEAAAADQHL